jgi:hypothetical protein
VKASAPDAQTNLVQVGSVELEVTTSWLQPLVTDPNC